MNSAAAAIMTKQRYLVVHDYGMGGAWGVMAARSEEEILQKYPQLEVVEVRPGWMSEATMTLSFPIARSTLTMNHVDGWRSSTRPNGRHSGMRRRDKIAKLFCAEGAGPESILRTVARGAMDSGLAAIAAPRNDSPSLTFRKNAHELICPSR